MAVNTLKYIENYLKIRDKKGKIIDFKLNAPQLKLYNTIKGEAKKKKPIRIIILKARQMGFSTLTEAIIFKSSVTNANVKSGIVCHEESATTNLFNMSKLYLSNLPDEATPKTKASNAKEIIFDSKDSLGLNSTIKCMTAGNSRIGRSDTFTNLHLSEFAFWPGDKMTTFTSLMQAVPQSANSLVIIESTANGYDEFKNLWDNAVAGKNDFVPVFCAWWELDEYQKEYDGFKLTDYEKSIKKRFNLKNEQLAWRRWCIANNLNGDENLFKQEYPASPEEAFIATGDCIFDKEKILDRIEQIKDIKFKKGAFEIENPTQKGETLKFNDRDYSFFESENGNLKIFDRPIDDHYYVIGADTAGEGQDSFAFHVIDNFSSKQVAVFECVNDEDFFIEQLYLAGKYFNDALIAIESNFSTYPIRKIQEYGYKKLYIREKFDSATKKIIKSYGFRTTSVTRPVIISELKAFVRDSIDLICDYNTLKQMLSFVKNKNGRAEAIIGEHDDLVLSLAITLQARSQQKIIKKKPEPEKHYNFEFEKPKNDNVIGGKVKII